MTSGYDVVVSKESEALLAAELSHSLGLKGYCVLDSGIGDDVLEGAHEDAGELRQAGRLKAPPEQVVDGVLGPEGTRELAWLSSAQDGDAVDGDQLREVCRQLSLVTGFAADFCAGIGIEVVPTRTLAVRGGEVPDQCSELTDDECIEWLSTFVQARLMVILCLGPGEGSLELQPLDDDSGDVEIATRRGTIVVLRADTLLHRHVSSTDDYTLCCWLREKSSSGPRGWSEMDTRKLEGMPAVKELHTWMQGRLQAIADMEIQEKLDGAVSRELLKLAHHSFFRKDKNPVAVRGDAGHLPGAWDPEVFWMSLNGGIDYVTTIPAMRWDHTEYYDPAPDSWTKSYNFRPPTYIRTNVRHGQFIEGCELFDTKFFGISPMEAKGMDPMQKHILETSYEALFSAGYKKKELMNNYIAVFTGCSNPEWNYIDREAGACSGTGSSQAITSNRTSFALGMMGPSSSIDCEMSSASVALMVGSAAVATTNTRRVESGGNSSAAVVGGVFLTFTPFMWPRFNAWMNGNGRCFTFDQSANGYIRGEMCGSVCLKPYAEKVDDELIIPERPCVGCITGWRMVSNGKAASLTAPHGPSQQECVYDAIRDAAIDPLDLDAVECHGSGGQLDDSVEVSSLSAVLRGMPGGEKEVLALGSVKTHVGAQCEACGMASLLKLVYNIGYASQCPSNHLKTLNPHIDLGDGAIIMNSEALAYRGRSAFHGFSSRGLGGTMVHGVVWFYANDRKVRLPQARMDRQVFTFWPGGGGVLDASVRPAHGYYIAGSWNHSREAEEMKRADDGSFTFTAILGINRVESFQICLDGDYDRILHPPMPSALSGTPVEGPSGPEQAAGLRWVIDGRPGKHAWLVASEAGEGAAVQHPELVFRDQGVPGDQYEIRLHIAGKYRAISWHKVKSVVAAEGAAVPLIVGKYYLSAAWTDWAFEEMTELGPGIYSVNTCLGFGKREFVIVRNRDFEQVFCASSLTASRSPAGSEVTGPGDWSAGFPWRFDGHAGETFTVEFQRSVSDGLDECAVAWRRREV